MTMMTTMRLLTMLAAPVQSADYIQVCSILLRFPSSVQEGHLCGDVLQA